MKLYWWNPLENKWIDLSVLTEETGTFIKISEWNLKRGSKIGLRLPDKFKLEVKPKDLGMDNWLTFWIDEGIKEASINCILKYGRKETTYIYPRQVDALKYLRETLNRYLSYCETVTQRIINQIS